MTCTTPSSPPARSFNNTSRPRCRVATSTSRRRSCAFSGSSRRKNSTAASCLKRWKKKPGEWKRSVRPSRPRANSRPANGNSISASRSSARRFTSTKATDRSLLLLKPLPHRRGKQRDFRQRLGLNHGDLVRVAGSPIAFAAEIDRVPANIDHFWITIGIGTGEPIRIALSTYSRQNAAAGFDPRMRVGIVASTWSELPAPGLVKSPGLDYPTIEAAAPVNYLEYDRPALELQLTDKAKRAVFIEAWGELYVRTHIGIHQVHSMRASCSVARDLIGRDGAIRFYFTDGTGEMLLFKYCGQA